MVQEDKIKERKRYNAPFLRAFNYLAGEKMMNQKQFAKVIEAESSYISALKNGTKRVGPDYMARLASAFVKHFDGKGHLNMDYLLGKSEYMLVENIPDEEIIENIGKESNPDYEVIKRKRKEAAKNLANYTPQQSSSVDMSSQLNASISAYVQLTNRLTDDLKRKDKEMSDRLADKDAIIAEKSTRIAILERTIVDKEEIIRAREASIATLERKLADINMQDLSRYPFAIGAADDAHNKNVSPHS